MENTWILIATTAFAIILILMVGFAVLTTLDIDQGVVICTCLLFIAFILLANTLIFTKQVTQMLNEQHALQAVTVQANDTDNG